MSSLLFRNNAFADKLTQTQTADRPTKTPDDQCSPVDEIQARIDALEAEYKSLFNFGSGGKFNKELFNKNVLIGAAISIEFAQLTTQKEMLISRNQETLAVQSTVPTNLVESLQFDDADTDQINYQGHISITDQTKVSLELDGEHDYIVAASDSTRDLDRFTISAWVKPDYSSGSPEFTVVSKGNAFVLAINNNIPPYKVAKFSVYDGISWHTVESTSEIKEEWTHLAATFDDSSISIHVNGNLESTLAIENVLAILVDGKFAAVPVDSISSDSDIVISEYLPVTLKSAKASNQFTRLIDNVQPRDSLLIPLQTTQLYNFQLWLDNLLCLLGMILVRKGWHGSVS